MGLILLVIVLVLVFGGGGGYYGYSRYGGRGAGGILGLVLSSSQSSSRSYHQL